MFKFLNILSSFLFIYIMYIFANDIMGVLLYVGGTCMFADLGHFSVGAIQISSCSVLFPSIVLAYFGQASYFRKHNQDASNPFYSSAPRTFSAA